MLSGRRAGAYGDRAVHVEPYTLSPTHGPNKGGQRSMHASAMAQMRVCVDHYLRAGKHYRVLDLGSRQIRQHHETQQSLLAHLDYEYVGADVVAGPNVDIVMTKPYRIPVKANSFDVVMSNQAFEHIPFPWASLLEMSRIVKP